jgi:MoxR-like ATPase
MTPDTVAGALTRHGYLPDEGISTAVFLAMTLHRPLLLEGEAGSAKPSWPRHWPPPPAAR